MKITAKIWNAYQSMLRESMPCFNDGYNLREHGITYAQFSALQRIAESALGMGWRDLKRAELAQLIEGRRVCLAYAQREDLDRLRAAFGVAS